MRHFNFAGDTTSELGLDIGFTAADAARPWQTLRDRIAERLVNDLRRFDRFVERAQFHQWLLGTWLVERPADGALEPAESIGVLERGEDGLRRRQERERVDGFGERVNGFVVVHSGDLSAV